MKRHHAAWRIEYIRPFFVNPQVDEPGNIHIRRNWLRSGFGQAGYDPPVLFRGLLPGQWHGLSDPKLKKSLKVRLDFMPFSGLDLHSPIPKGGQLCRRSFERPAPYWPG